MATLLERLGIHMPQYHRIQVDRFTVKTKPRFFLRRWVPYFVGDTVHFWIQIDDTEQIRDGTPLYVFEVLGSRERRVKDLEPGQFDNQWIPIAGNPIDREGDVIYSVGIHFKTAMPILSAYVINTDRWVIGCIGWLAGIITAIASGIILGFIKVEPILRMFITP